MFLDFLYFWPLSVAFLIPNLCCCFDVNADGNREWQCRCKQQQQQFILHVSSTSTNNSAQIPSQSRRGKHPSFVWSSIAISSPKSPWNHATGLIYFCRFLISSFKYLASKTHRFIVLLGRGSKSHDLLW